ncbi:MAG: hypothetical protein AAF206_13745, partial [Bacteroidota bacterium]
QPADQRAPVATRGEQLIPAMAKRVAKHHMRHENQDGRGYNLVVDDPLIFQHSCTSTGNELPSAGAFTIKFRNLINPLTLDFGDGSCDRTATLTWRQNDYVLNL